MYNGDDYIKIEEVAYLVGCNIQTLNYYYRFKRDNPDNEYALILPDYIQQGSRSTRFWRRGDIEAIKDFRRQIPKGRNGVLGCVTQRHHKRKGVGASVPPKTDSNPGRAVQGGYIFTIETLLKRSNVELDAVEMVREILQSEYEWRTGRKVS